MIKPIQLIFLITLFAMNTGFGQESPMDSLFTYEMADTTPEPIGGMKAAYKWIANQQAEATFDRTDTLDCDSNRGGSVMVMFVITKEGKLTNLEIGKGISEPYDNYCLKIMANLPLDWKPGTKDGKPVKVKMGQSFTFCPQ